MADQDALGLEWHDDAVRDRLAALSINIGAGIYRGGRLELRDRKAGKILARVSNRGIGSAILFRIGPTLQHRNSPVIGSVAKTAFAGWFMARPDYTIAARRELRRVVPADNPARVRKLRTGGASRSDAHATLSPALVWRRIGGETLVINLRSGKSYRLDETGGKIWKMLAKGIRSDAIADAIAAEYAIAATTVRGDIDLMLHDLARAGLIASLNPQ
ncbi:MAG: PqqD family protein [Candidatus Binataceae bacterium]